MSRRQARKRGFLLACRDTKLARVLRRDFAGLVDMTCPGESLGENTFAGIVVVPPSPNAPEAEKLRWEEWVDYLKTRLAPGAQLVVL